VSPITTLPPGTPPQGFTTWQPTHHHRYGATKVLVFLDIDGVCNKHGGPHHGKLNPELVGHIGRLIQRHRFDTQIVFNTAWNTNTLDEMKVMFTAAGFKHPECLVGQTSSTRGGGHPIREYLIENDLIGTPFIIIDDSTHDYGEMWCRLIACNGSKGFDKIALKEATEQMWHSSPNESRDRHAAIDRLLRDCHRLARRCPWLTDEQRQGYIRRNLNLIEHCLLVPDFLVAAYLKKPEGHVAPAPIGKIIVQPDDEEDG
jgi:hypothetical protein